jgi:hypothetical protein
MKGDERVFLLNSSRTNLKSGMINRYMILMLIFISLLVHIDGLLVLLSHVERRVLLNPI